MRFPLIGALKPAPGDGLPLSRPTRPWGYTEQSFPLETEYGEVAATLGNATCAATGSQQFGSVAATLGEATCSASGTFQQDITGTVAATLADCTLAAQGGYG